jgi:hypothetical protein
MTDSMNLKTLHGKRVSVSVPIQNRAVVVSGVASFLNVPDLGPALRIDVDDPAGVFRLLIKESEWDGTIHSVGAGHLISLSRMRRDCDWPPRQNYIARGQPSYGGPEV